MEISSGNNFYQIQNDSVLFWGMDIPSLNVKLNKTIIEFIENNQLPYNEVIEISEFEDEALLELIMSNT